MTTNAYKPLSDSEVKDIHKTVLKVLEEVGMGDPSPDFTKVALDSGCRLSDEGRLLIPAALVEDVVSRVKRQTVRHGIDPDRSIDLTRNPVTYGPAGFAPKILDFHTGDYRDALLLDFYDMARIMDKMAYVTPSDNLDIQDLPNSLEEDINKAYSLISGTSKSIGMSFLDPANIDPVTSLFDTLLGGEGRFKERPFCHALGVTTLSPLSYEELQSSILIEAARRGYPVLSIVAPMAGSTAPAAPVGALVQSVAEALASLVQLELMVPGVQVTLTLAPFVTDLRNGSFTGGSAEGALLNASAAQMLDWYGLTACVAGNLSDSKGLDMQCGAEKGVSGLLSTLACASNGGIIGLSTGMTASLIGYSHEQLVYDNESMGLYQRVLRGMSVTEETLSYDVIADVVKRGGHFLNHKQTFSVMKKEYFYPKLLDRGTIEAWADGGGEGVRSNIRDQVRNILSTHYPEYITPDLDSVLRDRFPIKLPREEMRPNDRW